MIDKADTTGRQPPPLKVLIVFGTRPEAIKLAPVIKALRARPCVIRVRVCVTAQHRAMLDQMLGLFGIRPDIDLDLMQPGQTLPTLTSHVLTRMTEVLEEEQPDWVLVQGDTTTVMAAALAAFYAQIRVGHVEAGLRTNNPYNPFPEEINRRLSSVLTTYHFAPTARARDALLAEGVPADRVFLTGNTIVDAVASIIDTPPSPEAQHLLDELDTRRVAGQADEDRGRKLVLVTAHRRESFGGPFESLCRGLRSIAEQNEDVFLIYPVHLNPRVQEPVRRILAGHDRVKLLEPLSYEPFLRLMAAAHLVLTDSGGIQEEATVLGKPVLVLREVTERPELVESGIGKLVGTDKDRIAAEARRLLTDPDAYAAAAHRADLYGDGHAAERIVSILLDRGDVSRELCWRVR